MKNYLVHSRAYGTYLQPVNSKALSYGEHLTVGPPPNLTDTVSYVDDLVTLMGKTIPGSNIHGYILRFRHEFAIDVPSSSKADGESLQLQAISGISSQMWTLIPPESGRLMRVMSSNSGLVMDVSVSGGKSVIVQKKADENSNSQIWSFEEQLLSDSTFEASFGGRNNFGAVLNLKATELFPGRAYSIWFMNLPNRAQTQAWQDQGLGQISAPLEKVIPDNAGNISVSHTMPIIAPASEAHGVALCVLEDTDGTVVAMDWVPQALWAGG